MVWRMISIMGVAATLAAIIIFEPRSTLLASTSDDPTGSKCVGERVPLVLASSHLPFLNIRVGSRQGWFVLDSGTNINVVDFRSYDFPGPDVTRTISGSSLPTLESTFFRSRDLSFLKGPSDEPVIGFIAADFLGSRTVEIRFDDEKPFIAVSNERCSAAVFEENGLRGVEQRGYFTSHWFWKWWMLWRGGNLPVAFVRIGNTVAPALIDSGYSGEMDRTLQINEAFFEHLRKEGVVMKPAGTTTLTDCIGQKGSATLWTVVDAPLSFTTETGAEIRTFGPPILEVKPAGRSECGKSIGHQSTPWAQIGMMHLLRLGAVVIDGPNDKVWIPQQRAAASPVRPFGAISLAWTARGDWSISNGLMADAETEADALNHCNNMKNRQGTCQTATAVKSDKFGCLALANNKKALQSQRRLSVVTADSWTAARDGAIRECKNAADAECELVHTICNG
jgi:hypothetical protein